METIKETKQEKRNHKKEADVLVQLVSLEIFYFITSQAFIKMNKRIHDIIKEEPSHHKRRNKMTENRKRPQWLRRDKG